MDHAHTPSLLRWLLAVAVAASGLALTPAAAQSGTYPDWGRTAAHDQRYRQACHGYRYRYNINPPTNDWHLETWLVSPAGRKIAADLYHAGEDPRRDRVRFRVCGAATRPGEHVIKAKVTWKDGFDENVVKLRPTRFRLTRG